MVLPMLLTSVSWRPKFALVNAALFTVTAVNFSVCEALCALAMAGSANTPVVPMTAAAPAAAMDLRTFMIPSPEPGSLRIVGLPPDPCKRGNPQDLTNRAAGAGGLGGDRAYPLMRRGWYLAGEGSRVLGTGGPAGLPGRRRLDLVLGDSAPLTGRRGSHATVRR